MKSQPEESKCTTPEIGPEVEEKTYPAVWQDQVTGVFSASGKMETRTVTVHSVSGHLAKIAKRA